MEPFIPHLPAVAINVVAARQATRKGLLTAALLVGVAAFSSMSVVNPVIAEGIVTPLSATQYTTTTEINGDSLSQIHGVLGVNQAAGDSNAQSNSRAIAISQDGGVAIAYTFDKQSVGQEPASSPEIAIATIGENAFTGTSGLISVNQASGLQNIQLNAFAMARDLNGELSDASLAETFSDSQVALPGGVTPVLTRRETHVDSSAFVGASGIVQLNQSSGTGNVSLNRFEMSMSPSN